MSGSSAFVHKGGLHVSAVVKNPQTYEHVPPESVGNERIIPVSDQAGRSNVLARLAEAGIGWMPPDAWPACWKTSRPARVRGYSL